MKRGRWNFYPFAWFQKWKFPCSMVIGAGNIVGRWKNIGIKLVHQLGLSALNAAQPWFSNNGASNNATSCFSVRFLLIRARKLNLVFLLLTPSPPPFINSTDIPSSTKLIQSRQKVSIPSKFRGRKINNNNINHGGGRRSICSKLPVSKLSGNWNIELLERNLRRDPIKSGLIIRG